MTLWLDHMLIVNVEHYSLPNFWGIFLSILDHQFKCSKYFCYTWVLCIIKSFADVIITVVYYFLRNSNSEYYVCIAKYAMSYHKHKHNVADNSSVYSLVLGLKFSKYYTIMCNVIGMCNIPNWRPWSKEFYHTTV